VRRVKQARAGTGLGTFGLDFETHSITLALTATFADGENRSLKYCLQLIVVMALVGIAGAAPISNCLLNDPADIQQGITCNIFESLNDGTPSEVSGLVALPIIAVAGYIGVLENAGGSHTDPSQWSDVLSFVNRGDGLAVSLQLLSIGCNVAAGDTSCFPNPAQVAAFIVESAVDPTVFVAPAIIGDNFYNIYSSDVPEPATAGLVVIALLVGRTSRSARDLLVALFRI